MNEWRRESFGEFLHAIESKVPKWMKSGLDSSRQVYITNGEAHLSIEPIPALEGAFVQLGIGLGGIWPRSLMSWFRDECGLRLFWIELKDRRWKIKGVTRILDRSRDGEARGLYEIKL